MFYGYLDNWLFCTSKITCLTSQLCALRFYQVCFSRLMRNEQKDLTHKKKNSWIINNLLDLLVCSIAEYFH